MKKNLPALIGLIGSLITEAAFCFYASRTGLWLQPFVGVFLILFFLLIYAGLGSLIKRFKVTERKAISMRVAFWLALATWQLVQGYLSGTPKAMFERLAMSPMPSSIRDFQWRGGAGIDGVFILSFTAAPEDTKRLIEYRQLKPYADSDWLVDTNQTEALNLNLSNRCFSAGMSFVLLESPVVYRSQNPHGPGWNGQLVTDSNHRRVHLFL